MVGVERIKNPILAAASLLEQGPHTFLWGAAAESLAEANNLELVPNSYFTTPFRKVLWNQSTESSSQTDGGTVGAVVLDSHGHLAAAGSTGGLMFKADGRIGDTAVLGAGLYADQRLAIIWLVTITHRCSANNTLISPVYLQQW